MPDNGRDILFKLRFLGIPCIGYVDSDPQRICQPKLSVDLYDIERARKLCTKIEK